MNLPVDLASIAEAESVALVRERAVAAFRATGFAGAYFLTPITTDRRFGRVASGLNVSEDWLTEYRKGLWEADPLPDLALRLGRPLRWSEAGSVTDLSVREKAFFARAAEFGMSDGVACIAHGPAGRTGFIGITFPENADVFGPESLVLCHTITQMSFLRYCELIDTIPLADVKLSARELDVLEWVAQGKSNSVIADILGISAETVDSYVRRIFAKLDVSDRTSAVVRAVLGGHLFVGGYRKEPHAGRDPALDE